MKFVIPVALLFLAQASLTAVAQDHSQAPSFTLEAADGRSLDLPADQQGVGIYLFWASWCPYCRALMPHLQSLVDEFGGRVTVYALNFRDQQDPAEYLDERGFDFVLLPQADDVAERWGVTGTPGLFIVDEKGRIRFNLYEVLTTDPPGFEQLNHTQRAQRRAPLWGARIREALDEVLVDQAPGD